MDKIIFLVIVILIFILPTAWSFTQIYTPMGNPMGTSMQLLTIVILSIIWIFLPIRLYRKNLIRWLGYFFTGVIILMLIGIVWLLFEIFTCTEGCYMAMGYLPFVIVGLLINIFITIFLFRKIRKALKELKQENEQRPTIKT